MEVVAGIAAAGAIGTWLARQIKKLRIKKEHKRYLRDEDEAGALADGGVPVVQGSLGEMPSLPPPQQRRALTYGGPGTVMRVEEPPSPTSFPLQHHTPHHQLILPPPPPPAAPPLLLGNGSDPVLTSQQQALAEAHAAHASARRSATWAQPPQYEKGW
jgi:hypothetical protein